MKEEIKWAKDLMVMQSAKAQRLAGDIIEKHIKDEFSDGFMWRECHDCMTFVSLILQCSWNKDFVEDAIAVANTPLEEAFFSACRKLIENQIEREAKEARTEQGAQDGNK